MFEIPRPDPDDNTEEEKEKYADHPRYVSEVPVVRVSQGLGIGVIEIGKGDFGKKMSVEDYTGLDLGTES